MDRHISVEPFHPGEIIKEEIEARKWTHEDLADVMGCSRHTVLRLIKGATGVTAETAIALAKAFGTSAQLWMNLQTSFELSQAAKEDRDIERRAKLYNKVPLRDIKKRGWIDDIDGTDQLESAVLDLLRIKHIDETPAFLVAAKKSTSYSSNTPEQIAWFARAHQIAGAAPASKYVESKLEECIEQLRGLAAYPEDVRHVPKLLADFGIRLLLIDRLPKSKVDGVAFWINKGASPVIAMSLRFDRIDNFWHNILHEIVHIKYHDESPIDVNVFCEDEDSDLPDIEKRANSEACNYLIPTEKLESFIKRHGRLIYESDVVRQATARGVHPGILVGQLHWRKALDWKFQNKMKVKIRDEIVGVAITDGWGHIPKIK